MFKENINIKCYLPKLCSWIRRRSCHRKERTQEGYHVSLPYYNIRYDRELMVRLKESTLESGLLSAEEFDKRVRPERKLSHYVMLKLC
jgi:hypothetical protein